LKSVSILKVDFESPLLNPFNSLVFSPVTNTSCLNDDVDVDDSSDDDDDEMIPISFIIVVIIIIITCL
jgi:hypothetical protein